MYMIKYTGDGATTEFEFEFPFFKFADIKISVNSVILTDGSFSIITSDTPKYDGMYTGGRVVFTVAPVSGAEIRIWRKIDLSRTIDYQPTLPIKPDNLNADFNFLLEYLKDLYELDGDVANIENALEFLDTIAEQIEALGDIGELAKKDEIPDVSNFALKNHTHDMSEYAVNSVVSEELANKLNKNQGIANYGKVMQVGADGNLFPSSEANGLIYVNHDNTLNGTGTNSQPLSVAEEEKISNKITNCILNVPQNIDLSLENGVLKLKAGSTVYVPNGVGVYNKNTLVSDGVFQLQNFGQSKGVLVYGLQDDYFPFERTWAGPTEPTNLSGNTHIWYDTANNVIKYTSNAGTTWNTYNISLPIAVVSMDSSGTITSIDQVFNGFGFIGNLVYALPDLRVSEPNGRNTNGTNKNIVESVNNVITFLVQDNNRTEVYANANYIVCVPKKTYTYNAEKNIFLYPDGTQRFYAKIADIKIENSKIIDMYQKLSFQATDYNEADFVTEYQLPTSDNNYTWYRLYKSGWVEQGGKYTNLTNQSITLPIELVDANYTPVLGYDTSSANNAQYSGLSYSNKTTTGFVISNAGQINGGWVVCYKSKK